MVLWGTRNCSYGITAKTSFTFKSASYQPILVTYLPHVVCWYRLGYTYWYTFEQIVYQRIYNNVGHRTLRMGRTVITGWPGQQQRRVLLTSYTPALWSASKYSAHGATTCDLTPCILAKVQLASNFAPRSMKTSSEHLESFTRLFVVNILLGKCPGQRGCSMVKTNSMEYWVEWQYF